MENLKLSTPDLAEEKFRKLAELFPNAVTETMDISGKVVRSIDADVLRREISSDFDVVEGNTERYQFTWPGKRKSLVLSNQPIDMALHLERDKSVGRDGTPGSIDTENIYIEGDNLEALKLLRETYLGKVKMIYIDPPYNTGNDFIYKDKYSQRKDEYLANSGQLDERGGQLVQKPDDSGRRHTNWLNMMFPRLRIARELLSDDGVIFISIDDNEQANLKKICDEIFGLDNFIAQINWKGRGGRQDSKFFAAVHEFILVYARSSNEFVAGEEIKSGDVFPFFDDIKQRFYKTQLLRKWGSNSRRVDRPNLFYPIVDPDGQDLYPMLSEKEEGCWRWGKSTMDKALKEGKIKFEKKGKTWIPYEKIFAPLEGEEKTKKYVTWLDDISNGTNDIKKLFNKSVFDYAKSSDLVKVFLKMANVVDEDIILDFFSGSATTAHALMQLNAEDGGHRKFIMIQIPEKCNEKSIAYKEGYKTICDIGEERIRRAGKKIKEESPLMNSDLDIGFRVFRVGSSNMNDVSKKPDDYDQDQLDLLVDNIKEQATPEDLLFQTMLRVNIPLSSQIDEKHISGKKVFSVNEGYLLACFDSDITDDAITEIARKKPYFAVFRDNGMASDSVRINYEQIFKLYSPQTSVKVL